MDFLAPYTNYIIAIQNKFQLENGFIFASFDGDGISEKRLFSRRKLCALGKKKACLELFTVQAAKKNSH